MYKRQTDTLADAADGVRELTSKAGEAVGSVSGTVAGIDSKLGGVSTFLRQVSNGGVSDMFGNFFRNLGQGNVSGLSIACLLYTSVLCHITLWLTKQPLHEWQRNYRYGSEYAKTRCLLYD